MRVHAPLRASRTPGGARRGRRRRRSRHVRKQAPRHRRLGRHRSRRRNPPAAPAATPEVASSTTTVRAGSTPSSSAPSRYPSGAGLPASPRSAATMPSTTTSKRSPSRPLRAGPERRSWTRTRSRSARSIVRRGVERGGRTGVRRDAVAFEDVVEQHVLAVAQRTHRVVAGWVGRVTVGQRHVAGREERTHAVVAGLAVDVREVVRPAVKLVGREQLAPGVFVDLGGRGDHPVQVEQHAVVVAPGEVGVSVHHVESRSASRPHDAGRECLSRPGEPQGASWADAWALRPCSRACRWRPGRRSRRATTRFGAL